MSKPPEPRPRSSACALTITSSPTCAAPTSATSAIAGRARAVQLDHEILLGAVRGTGVDDGGAAELQHGRGCKLRRATLPAPPAPERLADSDAHIDVALPLGQVGQLVRASDHLGRDRVRVLGVRRRETRPPRAARAGCGATRIAPGSSATGEIGGAHERDAPAPGSRSARATTSAPRRRRPRGLVRRPPPPAASAAAMNSRNSGAGRSGRDLNSGWNWEATKNG